MYQYEVLIYVYFRKDIKWGQVSYNLRELLNKYLRWSRSRAKVTAPAPAKYPGSGRLRLRNPVYSNEIFLDFCPKGEPKPTVNS